MGMPLLKTVALAAVVLSIAFLMLSLWWPVLIWAAIICLPLSWLPEGVSKYHSWQSR
jgi:hypothetical protein